MGDAAIGTILMILIDQICYTETSQCEAETETKIVL